jgi:hypothetical protein
VASACACRVTATDPEGVEHSVEVSAESLYEALALAICALRQDDWSPPPGLRVRVAVRQPVVEHVVEMRRFEAAAQGHTSKNVRERRLTASPHDHADSRRSLEPD